MLTEARYDVVRVRMIDDAEAMLQAIRYLQASCPTEEARAELRIAWKAQMQVVRRLREARNRK